VKNWKRPDEQAVCRVRETGVSLKHCLVAQAESQAPIQLKVIAGVDLRHVDGRCRRGSLAALRELHPADYDNRGSVSAPLRRFGSQQLEDLYVDKSSDSPHPLAEVSFTLVALRHGGERSWFSCFPTLMQLASRMVRRFGREELKARLRATSPLVVPSILACDFGQLEHEIGLVEKAGAKALHLDVMDGHFVPNLSFGIPIVEAARRATDLPLDVHLMIDRPEEYIEPFREAGADGMTIHVEAVPEPPRVLERIRSLGAWAGLALNPPTPVSAIEASLPYCDLILVMSVMPGFGGQVFDGRALEKLRTLRDRQVQDALLEVDGGITPETIGPCTEAGVDLCVTGTAIFHADDYRAAMRQLESAMRRRVPA
jgi:ribulose-phosphate 3-epimerase